MALMDIETFLATCGDAKERTKKEYGAVLKRTEAKLGVGLMEASQSDVIALAKAWRADLREGGAAQYARVLKLFYRRAGRLELLPFLKMRQRLRKLEPAEILGPEDVAAMIHAANSARDRALIAVLWDTGRRIHEVLALRCGDIRLTPNDHMIAWFRKVKVDGEQGESVLADAAPFIQEWLKAHPYPSTDAPLFPSDSNHGKPVGMSTIRALLPKIAKRAGLTKKVYPHLFRHSRATHLLRLGMSNAQVEKLLGWTAGSPMLGRYSHLANRDAQNALLEKLGLPTEIASVPARLEYRPEELRPVVPMIPSPATNQTITLQEVSELLSDPKVQEFLRLLQVQRPVPA